MTLRSAVFLASTLVCSAAADLELLQVKTVYLLPMTNGLDQYLANRITRVGQFRVTTDPAQADAIFTDKLGSAFEDAMEELYPPPAPVEPVRTEKEEEELKKKKRQEAGTLSLERTDLDPRKRVNVWSRGKGNVFLVDRKSKEVLWSDYRRPKSTRPDEMHRTADKIVDRLIDHTKPKK
jgi:hypothetical protein